MKLGMLHPGSARRLFSLPPGNQLEVAAAVQSAKLGPWETELLVSLSRRTKDPNGAPRAVVRAAGEPAEAASGDAPARRWIPACARRGNGCVAAAPLHSGGEGREPGGSTRHRRATDRAILDEELRTAAEASSRLATELGSARTGASAVRAAGAA